MLTQLNPPLPLETTKGPGWAHFVIDYGPESALLWVVFMDAGRLLDGAQFRGADVLQLDHGPKKTRRYVCGAHPFGVATVARRSGPLFLAPPEASTGFVGGPVAAEPLLREPRDQNPGCGKGHKPAPADGPPDLQPDADEFRIEPGRVAARLEGQLRTRDGAAPGRHATEHRQKREQEKERRERNGGNQRAEASGQSDERREEEESQGDRAAQKGDQSPDDDAGTEAAL